MPRTGRGHAATPLPVTVYGKCCFYSRCTPEILVTPLSSPNVPWCAVSSRWPNDQRHAGCRGRVRWGDGQETRVSEQSVYRLSASPRRKVLLMQQTFAHCRGGDAIMSPTGRILISHSAGWSTAGRVHTHTCALDTQRPACTLTHFLSLIYSHRSRLCFVRISLSLRKIWQPFCSTHLCPCLHLCLGTSLLANCPQKT